MKRPGLPLLLALLLIFGVAPLAPAQQISRITADDSQLLVETTGAFSGPVRLLGLPPYDLAQEWVMGGDGGRSDTAHGGYVMTFFTPSKNPFDPFISNPRVLDAGHVKYFAMRIKLTNAPSPMPFAVFTFPAGGGAAASAPVKVTPTGDWQIVRVDLAYTLGANWQGLRTIRLDPAEGEPPNPGKYANTKLEIDWIAVTNDAAFTGEAVPTDPYAGWWKFDYRTPLYQGTPTGPISIARQAADQHDRFYDRFLLLDDATQQSLGNDCYVTDFPTLGQSFSLPQPSTIKGLQVQLVQDAIALGVKHAALNVVVSQIVNPSLTNSTTTWTVDGQAIPIDMNGVRALDNQVKPLSNAGMRVYLIMLNSVPSAAQGGNPLIHPRTDLANAPYHLGAFNLTDAQGLRYYRAAFEFLANRYASTTTSYGKVVGYIIGNELTSHWSWYNLGLASEAQVLKDYGLALRVADLAVRRQHRDLRVFISLDHFWTITGEPNPLHNTTGKTFITNLAAGTQAHGDFPWDVAYHPYPENLFEPRFWYDQSATLSLNTPRITFKNIELLPLYLQQSSMRYHGQARRVILSEQGFHTPDQADGQEIQAAAYAYAWHKISNIPGIDAFILHRHVDHRDEGGLHLGLWTRVDDPNQPCTPLAQKKIYNVFKQADTAQWASAFQFALPVIGLNNWDEALPARTAIDFTFDSGLEGWVAANQVSGLQAANGLMSGTATGGDPFLERPRMYLAPDQVRRVTIRMRVSAGPSAQLFWTTASDPNPSEAKSIVIPVIADGLLHDYVLDLSRQATWAGQEITGLRLDPTRDATNATFAVASIQDDDGTTPRTAVKNFTLYE